MKFKNQIVCLFLMLNLTISLFVCPVSATQSKQKLKDEQLLADARITIEQSLVKELYDQDYTTAVDIGRSVVEIDIGEVSEIDTIYLRFPKETTVQFTAEASEDYQTWKMIANYKNSNISETNFGLSVGTAARYMKICVLSEDVPCNEIEVYKKNNLTPIIEKHEPRLYKVVFSDTVGTEYEQACEFLAFLSIVEGKQGGLYYSDDALTRAEFAKIAVKTLNMEILHYDYSIFHDVNSSDVLSDYINTAYAAGLMSGYDDGGFHPGDKILRQEAYAVVCRLLKYDAILDDDILYPYNYIRALNSNSLFKKMEGAYIEPITRGETAVLIYNALHAKPYSVQSIQGDAITYTKESGTLLELTREISVKTGVLEAVEYNSIYYIANGINEGRNTLVISGIQYKYDTEKLNPFYFIGTEVDYYIDKSGEQPFCAFLLYGKKNSQILSYDVEDIEKITEEYITTAENVHKRIRISNNAMMMYNGISYGLYKNSFQVITDNNYGFMKLVDSNHDDVYDLIQYTDYQNEAIKVADADAGILMTSNLRIDFNNSDVACKLFLNDEEIALSQLQRNDILSVSESKNEKGLKYYEIHVGRDRISNVNIDSYDSEKGLIKVGETVYQLASVHASPGLTEGISVGKYSELILDGFGKVHQIDLMNTDNVWKYGFLVDVDEKGMDRGQIRMVDLNADVHTIPCDLPIYVDSETGSVKYSNINDLKQKLSDDNNGTLEQLVKYRTNSEGVIKRLETASAGQDFSRLSLDYSAEAASYKWAVSEWDYVYKVDSNTKYLIVPDNVRDYNKYRTRPVLNGEDRYNIRIYDTNERRVASVVVLYGEKGTFISDRALFLVAEVSQCLNADEDVVTALTGYKNGKIISIQEPYEDAFNDIAVGDVMYVVQDDKNQVFRFQKISSSDGNGDEWFNRFTTIENIGYMEIKDSARWYNLENVDIYVVDRKESKVTKGSMGDIQIGDEVLVSVRNFYQDLLIVYKNM